MLLPCLSKNCHNVPPEGQAFCIKCLAEAKPKNADRLPTVSVVASPAPIPHISMDADRVTINGITIEPPPAPASSRVGRRHTDRPPESIPMSEKYPLYYKKVGDLTEVDVYAVCQIFEVADFSGCVHHSIKKLLLPGTRTGGKTRYNDIKEARDTLTRWLEINKPK